MKRECGKYGSTDFEKTKLVMSDQIIRVKTEGKKDPILTTFVCKKCGNVEFGLELKEKAYALTKSIDIGLVEYLNAHENQYGEFMTGEEVEISFEDLSRYSGLKLDSLREVLPEYI